MEDRIKLGISSCLLGRNVRYDGGHKHDRYLTDVLGKFVDWVPVCPEVECGLPVPREAMHLLGDPESPRLVTIRTGIDHTDRMLDWMEGKLPELEKEELCGFVFKSRSPSSGMKAVKVYNPPAAPVKKGIGIFARAFMERFPLMPVEEEGRLHDARLRENFIERFFVFRRWRDFLKTDGTIRGLVSFHTDHKLLIMAHSQKALKTLGKSVAAPGHTDPEELFQNYLEVLMDGLLLHATARKNTNVLQHIMGYFKKQLSPDEKQELLEVIHHYHEGMIPLIVPIVLLKHYVRKYREPYLNRQHYLHPHPIELMLRNHV
jgi:uncharacterized protein YbgA (DUF1722 family)/uncharacterized protein YbbK (DUF523 family)